MSKIVFAQNELDFMKELATEIYNEYVPATTEGQLTGITNAVKKHNQKAVGAGTNRIAIDKSNNLVLKVPFRPTGIVDNRMELKLSKLASDVNKQRRHAKSIAFAANNENLLLQEKIVPLHHVMIAQAGLPLTMENLSDPKWIKAAYVWLVKNIELYYELIVEMYRGANGWIFDDLTPDRVLNFGFKKGDDGKLRLAILDYGLCFPKLVSEITCPNCKKTILPSKLTDLDEEKPVSTEQLYSCGCGKARLAKEVYVIAKAQGNAGFGF